MQQKAWRKKLLTGLALYLTGFILVNWGVAVLPQWGQALKITGYVIIFVSILYNSVFLYRFVKENYKKN